MRQALGHAPAKVSTRPSTDTTRATLRPIGHGLREGRKEGGCGRSRFTRVAPSAAAHCGVGARGKGIADWRSKALRADCVACWQHFVVPIPAQWDPFTPVRGPCGKHAHAPTVQARHPAAEARRL